MRLTDRLRRALAVGILAVLVVDAAGVGFCCMNRDAAAALSATVSSDTAPSPAGSAHTDDLCFCCARSLAAADAMPVLIHPVSPGHISVTHRLQPPSLPAPYHPPQTRS